MLAQAQRAVCILSSVHFMLVDSPGGLGRDLHRILYRMQNPVESFSRLLSPQPHASAAPTNKKPGHAGRLVPSRSGLAYGSPDPQRAPHGDPIIFSLRLAPFLFPNVIPDVVPPFSSLPPAHPHAPTTQPPKLPHCQTTSKYLRSPDAQTPAHARLGAAELRQSIYGPPTPNLPAHTTQHRRLFFAVDSQSRRAF